MFVVVCKRINFPYIWELYQLNSMIIEAITTQLETNKDVFKNLLKNKTEAEYLWKPQPEKWCLLEIVCHLIDEEVEDFRAKLKSQMPPPNFNGSDNALNSLLNETAMSPTPEQMFNANDPVSQFVNKDWSPVMKAIEKKKEFRP